MNMLHQEQVICRTLIIPSVIITLSNLKALRNLVDSHNSDTKKASILKVCAMGSKVKSILRDMCFVYSQFDALELPESQLGV